MLHFYSGTDRKKAREAMQKPMANLQKKGASILRITDANKPEDLLAALHSGGMFATERIVVLEGTLENLEMRAIMLEALPTLKKSTDHFFILEEKPDAATRKQVEKYAETSEKFDAAKKSDGGTTIFALANALRAGDRKALWVAFQRELLNDAAPEAIHGVLFWATKDMMLKSLPAGRQGAPTKEQLRAKHLIARLAELPHEARRRGEDLEYALERFVLSIAQAKV
jgi:DNA polymerase III delta subunit